MTTQEIIWTALPNGLTPNGQCQLSVMASPRLVSDRQPPELGDFDFADWPAVVNNATFGVFVDGGALAGVQRVSQPADSSLWSALFPPTTWVRPFEFRDMSQRRIWSFPMWSVLSYLDGLYENVARNSPDNLPPADQGPVGDMVEHLGETFGHFRLPHGRRALQRFEREPEELFGPVTRAAWEQYRQQHTGSLAELLTGFQKWWVAYRRHHALDDAFQGGTVIRPDADHQALGFPTKAAMDCYQAHRFFDRPEPAPAEAPDVPTLDFHQALGSLGDYPVLLRRLGLVVDLLVDIPPSEMPRHIRLLPEGKFAAFNQHRSPHTKFRRNEKTFVAAATDEPTTPIWGPGLLILRGADDQFREPTPGVWFGLNQLDADGSVQKLLNMASEMHSLLADKQIGRAGFDTPERTGLPALRSAGISMYRYGRGLGLGQRLAEESARNAGDHDEMVHGAEHLIRGYRVDVQDVDTGTWYSLCRRKGTYRVVPEGGKPVEITPPGQPIVDEGYVKAASATSADAEKSDLYLHEALFRWDGWSLVAPRPGRTIEAVAADGMQEERPTKPSPKPVTDFKLVTSFEPEEGSLPRLRFGKTYRLRVRTVDLAGNSAPFQATPDPAEQAMWSSPLFYSRIEPISPPAIVPRAELKEGEAVERMVIRSDFDKSPAEFAAEHPSFGYLADNDRHVVPPKTSQVMAETHGMFDLGFGPNGNPGGAYADAVREAATLERGHDGQPLPGSQMVPGSYPPDTVAPVDPVTGAPRPAPGSYLINTSASFPLAYLPDVMAAGASFRGLPGPQPWNQGFGGTWPKFNPFVLRLEELPGTVQSGQCSETPMGTAALEWTTRNRVLHARLGKGEVRVVRYSSYPDGTRFQHMGAWQRWVKGAPNEGPLTALAAAGGHWMISPFRKLILVHAVARPLCPPTLRLQSGREPGETFARISGRAFLSVKSTAYIDLHANWTDPVDSLSDLAPKDLAGRSHVTSQRVGAWIPEQQPFPPASPAPDDGTIAVPNNGGTAFPLPEEQGNPPSPYLRHEFGDTKHRWVKYRLTGTTRFREYFPPEFTTVPENITRTGEEVLVNVQSSARPDALRLLYVVPSFQWQKQGAFPAPIVQKRIGGGLRVWMQRPWYSSGVDERLGVVLWPASQGPVDARFAKYVTEIGRDRVWVAADPQTTLTEGDFTNKVYVEKGLPLPEVPDPIKKVDVVAFQPEYDSERQLWFCDIDLQVPASGPSYFPFVRLALARYQRYSVKPELKLSRVVQADFSQLLPTRTLTVTPGTDPAKGQNTLTITVSGPGLSDSHPQDDFNKVEVALEEHNGELPGDLGWAPIVTGTLTRSGHMGSTTWSGVILRPASTGRPRRVVVREREVYTHEWPEGQSPIRTNRVAYADVVELPS
ncbi:MAG TPA: hypothetical protein VHF24_09080 [Acidimicrobiales bacterium]|nr:hypothetical protein [Acidimicrobiales bacterium]